MRRRGEPYWYILDDDRRAVPVDSLEQWAVWFEKHYFDGGRVVGKWEHHGVEISTVFLGMDHGFGGPPMIFETMIFGGPHDGEQWRHSTWEEAEAFHMATCRTLALETRQATTNSNEERET
jgi:hypothetical protein